MCANMGRLAVPSSSSSKVIYNDVTAPYVKAVRILFRQHARQLHIDSLYDRRCGLSSGNEKWVLICTFGSQNANFRDNSVLMILNFRTNVNQL